jgi:hypothetical protein
MQQSVAQPTAAVAIGEAPTAAAGWTAAEAQAGDAPMPVGPPKKAK